MLHAMVLAARLAITVATPPGLVSRDVAALLASEADAIWRRAGVDIQWSVGDRPGWDPGVPMLYIVFSDRCVADADGAMPLAAITFVDGQPVRRIVVCHNEVEAAVAQGEPGFRDLAPRAKDALVARVMGRAVAHEIGHYVFGPSHGADGLMRGRHSAAEFCADDAAPFAVDPPPALARTLPLR